MTGRVARARTACRRAATPATARCVRAIRSAARRRIECARQRLRLAAQSFERARIGHVLAQRECRLDALQRPQQTGMSGRDDQQVRREREQHIEIGLVQQTDVHDTARQRRRDDRARVPVGQRDADGRAAERQQRLRQRPVQHDDALRHTSGVAGSRACRSRLRASERQRRRSAGQQTAAARVRGPHDGNPMRRPLDGSVVTPIGTP